MLRTFLALIFLLTSISFVLADEFSVKEYNDFHRVLHQLQHEALPKNDFATIRNRAKELITLGDAIVKLGVPKGTKTENVDNVKKELKTFSEALINYGTASEKGSDAELKTSYEAVHERFEALAEIVER